LYQTFNGRPPLLNRKRETVIFLNVYFLLGFIAFIAKIRSIAADVARSVVCVSVCFVYTDELCKTVEPTEMPSVGTKKHVLDDGAHWRQLGNTSELSVHEGDATLCKITLTTFSRTDPKHFLRCLSRYILKLLPSFFQLQEKLLSYFAVK